MKRIALYGLALLTLVGLGAVAQPRASQADIRPRPSLSPFPTPTLPHLRIVSMGDSLTKGLNGAVEDSYRGPLSQLMTLTGQPHTWIVQAVGGSKCSHWAAQIDTVIATYDPDVVIVNCGTNDVPGVDNTEGDYLRIIDRVRAHGVIFVGSLTSQPDMESDTNKIRPYIFNWMRDTMLALKRAIQARGVPYFDAVRVPSTREWLQTDGIHLTVRSEAGYAELIYNVLRLLIPGWKSLQEMHLEGMCGLNGHWPDTPWPTDYRICTR